MSMSSISASTSCVTVATRSSPRRPEHWVTSSLSPRPNRRQVRNGKGRPLIVDHGRNAGELARLNGISLYAPHVASGNDFDAVRRPLRRVCLCAEDGLERTRSHLAKLS